MRLPLSLRRSMRTLAMVCALGLFAIPARAQVLTMPLPTLPENQEVVVLDLELAPGHASEPHRHNGHVFVFVVEGQVQMQVAGGELMTLSPGETFYENPDDVHVVSRNPSDTHPARILVHLIKTVGVPITTPANR